MKLIEIFNKMVSNKIVEDVSLWIVFWTLILAFAGLMVFSLRGIVKDNFESIYFFIGTAITLSGFTMLG